MQKKLFEIAFTTFVVVLIVAPIPPSTIVGIFLATHPKTSKFMNKKAHKTSMMICGVVVQSVKRPALAVGSAKEIAAKRRLAAGNVHL